jgi:hypothetical protein
VRKYRQLCGKTSSKMSDISDSENEVDVVEETLNVGCVTNKEFLKLTTSTCNYEDKENLGYENFDKKFVTQSRTGLQIYERHDDQ